MPRPKKNKQAGEAFKKLLKEKGFTQYKLEQVTGLDKGLISKIATGQTAEPKPTTLEKIATALGVELGELTKIFVQPSMRAQPLQSAEEPLPQQTDTTEEITGVNSDSVGVESAIADSASEDIEVLVQKVRKHPQHRDKIQDQCGTMRMLDIARPAEIDNIYIHVNVLEELPSNRHDLEIADFQGFSSTRDNFDRLGLGKVREPQVPGLEAVARYPKLMVLGKPGAGKTTFLKFLAIQCNQGKFQPERIPIFIELKVFARKARKQDDFSLLKYVNKELCVCEISEPQIGKMLHQGRFLILLDGLDEVKADDGDKVLTEVYDFSREYFKNQFVITCRIAALLANQRYSLGFTDVEVADFTSKQIEEFAQKWFVAVAKNSQEEGLATANQFIEKLNLPENEQIRELAVTPILLNLTCLVFQGRRDFPSKRSKLYEQGLEIMLKRWDESRGIKRDEVYRNLSLPHKIHLLSHVAAISFEQCEYFFEQSKVQQLIANYLCTLPMAATDQYQLQMDSEVVLKSLEAQHGLLVERARGIYSFSHLTFQEYFTAIEIVTNFNSQTLKNLLVNSTNDESGYDRWQEVYLLVAELFYQAPIADKKMQLLKLEIDELITQGNDLENFINQAIKKSWKLNVSYKTAAIQAFYLSCSIMLTNFIYGRQYFFGSFWMPIDRGLELACAIDPNLFRSEFDINLGFDLNLISTFDLASHLAYPCGYGCLNLQEGRIDKPEPSSIFNLTHELYSHLDTAIHYAVVLNCESLLQLLQQLKNKLPSHTDENLEKLVKWWGWDGEAWLEELRNVIMQHRNMGLEQWYDYNDFEILQWYRDANKLLVDCMNSGCEVPEELRSRIEDNLFLPIDSSLD